MAEGFKIFKEKYQKTSDKTVHGREINFKEGRFFITKVLKDANKWKWFDVDRTITGAAILWNTDVVIRMKFVDVSESSGTQATPSTKRDAKKRKWNPEKWKICQIKETEQRWSLWDEKQERRNRSQSKENSETSMWWDMQEKMFWCFLRRGQKTNIWRILELGRYWFTKSIYFCPYVRGW